MCHLHYELIMKEHMQITRSKIVPNFLYAASTLKEHPRLLKMYCRVHVHTCALTLQDELRNVFTTCV